MHCVEIVVDLIQFYAFSHFNVDYGSDGSCVFLSFKNDSCKLIAELLSACVYYYSRTGRRISFEYAMIDGVNDSDAQADLIAKKIRGMPGHVNLIPLNEVEESPLKPSRRTRQFQQRLESHGITATVRRSLGGDIDASCGQLRRKTISEGNV